MRTVLLMRHGKSAWDEEGIEDHDRSLAKRGKREAVHMGQVLRARNLLPDVILSSTAKRARSTVRRLVKASEYSGEVIYDERLYFQGLEPYLEHLSSLPDEVQSVLVIGHNPLLEELVLLLSGDAVRLPTAAMACIDLPITSWAGLNAGIKGKLRCLLRSGETAPKDLPYGPTPPQEQSQGQ